MESNDKRELILEAAAKMFSTKGFHDTKVEQIAEAAGVAKGTVYLYFKDKNKLLLEVHEYYRNSYNRTLDTVIQEHESARDKLLACTRFHHARFPEIFKFHKMNMEHLTKIHDPDRVQEVREGHKKTLRRLEEIIALGIERGEFREVNCTDAALACWGAMHAIVHFAMMNDSTDTEVDTRRADAVLEVVMQGFEEK